MCAFAFSGELRQRHAVAADAILDQAEALPGTKRSSPETPNGFRVTSANGPFFPAIPPASTPALSSARLGILSRWVMDRIRLIAECSLSEFPLPDGALGG